MYYFWAVMKVLLFSILMLPGVKVYAQGDVVIHSDARLAVLLRRVRSDALTTALESVKSTETAAANLLGNSTITAGVAHKEQKAAYTYSGKGFRVQIYNGPDREKAIAIKKEVMRRFPGVNTYLVYMAPGFRVKVGDYRLRGEAESMLRTANTMYKPSMIVPDMVTILAN